MSFQSLKIIFVIINCLISIEIIQSTSSYKVISPWTTVYLSMIKFVCSRVFKLFRIFKTRTKIKYFFRLIQISLLFIYLVQKLEYITSAIYPFIFEFQLNLCIFQRIKTKSSIQSLNHYIFWYIYPRFYI